MLEKLVNARRMLRPIKNMFYGMKKTETKEYKDKNIIEISIPYLHSENILLFCIDKNSNGSFISGINNETIENTILKSFETRQTERLTYEKWENADIAVHYFDAKIRDITNNNIYEVIMRIKQYKKNKDNKI